MPLPQMNNEKDTPANDSVHEIRQPLDGDIEISESRCQNESKKDSKNNEDELSSQYDTTKKHTKQDQDTHPGCHDQRHILQKT